MNFNNSSELLLVAKSSFTEVIEHIKNVKKRFGAEIVKKIMFNDDQTTTETLDDVDDRIMDTRNTEKYYIRTAWGFLTRICPTFHEKNIKIYVENYKKKHIESPIGIYLTPCN